MWFHEQAKDTHVSADSVLCALVGDKSISPLFSSCGLTPEVVESAVASVRGGRPVTSATSDEHYEALEKYGVDLVGLASTGKLDPVVGRDEEVR